MTLDIREGLETVAFYCEKCGKKARLSEAELLYCNRGSVAPRKVGPKECRLVPEHLHARCPRCHYEPDSVVPVVTDKRQPAVFRTSSDPLAGAKTGSRS